MMLPVAQESDSVTAMSGSRSRSGDNWIISISAGNVPFNDGEDFRLYDTGTGASISPEGHVATYQVSSSHFLVDGNQYLIWFNDNNDDGRVNGGDTIVIVDADRNLEGYEFRIAGTSLRVTL